MSSIEIRFISPGWRNQFDRPVDGTVLLDEQKQQLGLGFFKKGHKSFNIVLGIPRIGRPGDERDEGARIAFWNHGTKIEVPRGESFNDPANKIFDTKKMAEAKVDIREGGSAKLTVSGEVIAEIRHIPTL